MHKQLILTGFAITAALTLSACSNSNDKNSTQTSQLNPDAQQSVDDGKGGGDTTAIAGLWDGSIAQGDTNDVVYWNLEENGVLTRYDYQQDSAQNASGENCYVIGEPISVFPEEGDSYSFFNVATTVFINEDTLTITFIDADINDLDNDGDTTETPTLTWTLLNIPAVEDLNGCLSDQTTSPEDNSTDGGGDAPMTGTNNNPTDGPTDSSNDIPNESLTDSNSAGIPFDNAQGRPLMTRAECTTIGGFVIGDIGNGAIHRPEYRCESGKPPVARITYLEEEPIAPEGEVCCL